jgi:hypothetical protein
MPRVQKLVKLALAAKLAADHLSQEDRARVLRTVQTVTDRLRPAKSVDDAHPLKVAQSKHKGVFQVVMPDTLRTSFEAWIRSGGLVTYPLPGLDENELETLGVGPGAPSHER